MSETLKERVRDYIVATDFVSFAELANRFGDHFSGGDRCLEVQPNLVLWAGMTEEASDAVRTLLNEQIIFAARTTQLIYLCDGRSLTFPIAKRARSYAKPHWVPVTLRPIERMPQSKKGRRTQ
jgi:hypothetical protein